MSLPLPSLHELDLDVGFALGQFADFVWQHVQGDDMPEVRVLPDDELAELTFIGLSVGEIRDADGLDGHGAPFNGGCLADATSNGVQAFKGLL
jgi:hypothetical protein